MPGMDGFELTSLLRSEHAEMLLVALTGFGDEATARRAAEGGFDHFVLKPANVAEIDRAIRSVVSRDREER